jgi:hypothetical protein
MKWDVIFGGLIGAIFGFIGAVLTPFTDRLRKLIDERIIAPPHLFKLPLSVNYDIVEPKLPRRAIWIRTTFPRPSRGAKRC